MTRRMLMLLPLVCLTTVMRAPRLQAADSFADLLPETVAVYVEFPRPADLLAMIAEHPLRTKVEGLPRISDAMQTQPMRQLRAVIAIVEAELNADYCQLIQSVIEGGVAVAIDAQTEGVVLLAQSSDPDQLNRVLNTLTQLARADAERKGEPDPIESTVYHGIQAYGINKARFAIVDKWFVLTNQGDLGKRVIDQFLDAQDADHPNGLATLASRTTFQQARESTEVGVAAWGFVDVQRLRDGGVAKNVFQGKTENLLAEFLVGGMLSVLKQTPYAKAELRIDNEHAALAVSTPYQNEWIETERSFYFGEGGTGVAPSLTVTPRTVLSFSVYRDIAELWLNADALFDQRMVDELAKTDSNLTTLFAGRDFGEEVLGSLRPELQLIVEHQDFASRDPAPAIRLPAAAAVFRLRDAQRMPDELRRTFQSLVGFLNVAGAANGQPQLDQLFERNDDQQLVTTAYIPEDDERGSKQARINFNFSPSVAFRGDGFVLSSAEPLARRISADLPPSAVSEADAATADARVNLQGLLNFAALRDTLRDNRDQLIAQNMLEKGHLQSEAETEIDTLLQLLSWLREATLRLDTREEQLNLSLSVSFADAG